MHNFPGLDRRYPVEYLHLCLNSRYLLDMDLSHVMMEQMVRPPVVIGAWSHVSLASSSQSADRLYFSVQAVLYLGVLSLILGSFLSCRGGSGGS